MDKNNKKYATVNGSLYNKKKNNLIAYPDGRTSSYKVSKGTKYIGNQSFSGATVKKVVLPNTVKNIGYKAFENCKNLNNITIPGSVSFIDAKAFNNTKYYNTSKYWYKGQLYVANCVVDSKENIKSANLKSNTRLIARDNFTLYVYKNTAGNRYAKGNTFNYKVIK